MNGLRREWKVNKKKERLEIIYLTVCVYSYLGRCVTPVLRSGKLAALCFVYCEKWILTSDNLRTMRTNWGCILNWNSIILCWIFLCISLCSTQGKRSSIDISVATTFQYTCMFNSFDFFKIKVKSSKYLILIMFLSGIFSVNNRITRILGNFNEGQTFFTTWGYWEFLYISEKTTSTFQVLT